MLKEKNLEAINDRLDALEKKVGDLADRLDKKRGIPSLLKDMVSDDVPFGEESIAKSGSWFNRAGIALFLLGVAYFFKYAVEQGWIIPAVRIALGFVLGGILMRIGFRIQKKNRTFSQVMLGGGIAVFYITVFAAFHIEKLFPYGVSFLLMILVTVLAFFISLKFDDQALSVIGILGGFGTPFILYSGTGDSIIIVMYACIIFTGSCILFVCRDWPLLLWISMAGSWVVFTGINYAAMAAPAGGGAVPDAAVVQAGIMITWIEQWAAQSGRDFARSRLLGYPHQEGDVRGSGLLFLLSPLVSLTLSMRLWEHPKEFWGIVSLVLAGIYLAAYLFLRRHEQGRNAAAIQWKISLVLLTFALPNLFEGNMLLVSISLEAVLLHYILSKVDDRVVFISSNILFIVIRCWIAYRLVFPEEPGSALNPGTMADAFAIAALMASIRLIFNMTHARLYFAGTHVLLMIWLWRIISLLSDVAGYVTVAWTVLAVVLYAAGFIRRSPFLGRVSVGTLAAVVLKLVFYDIPRLETLYKVLIFTGLGLFLLVISYAIQNRAAEREGPT